jgi:glycerol-3-phosphate dehydrogenase
MDDYKLGMWVADQARNAGVQLMEHAPVTSVSTDGVVKLASYSHQFDVIANVAGPWAEELLLRSGISSNKKIDLIRGSHIVFEGEPAQPCLLQAAQDGRVFFVLPYQGKTLVGTAEKRQQKLLTVYGGKWTTARALGKKVADKLL